MDPSIYPSIHPFPNDPNEPSCQEHSSSDLLTTVLVTTTQPHDLMQFWEWYTSVQSRAVAPSQMWLLNP